METYQSLQCGNDYKVVFLFTLKATSAAVTLKTTWTRHQGELQRQIFKGKLPGLCNTSSLQTRQMCNNQNKGILRSVTPCPSKWAALPRASVPLLAERWDTGCPDPLLQNHVPFLLLSVPWMSPPAVTAFALVNAIRSTSAVSQGSKQEKNIPALFQRAAAHVVKHQAPEHRYPVLKVQHRAFSVGFVN